MRRPMQMTSMLVILMVGACATPPQVHEFNPVATIDADFDQVWTAVVEYFALTNLPIDTIEKDSGLIVTSWMDAGKGYGGGEDKIYCDCGGAGLFIQQWTRGRFSVFVKSNPAGGTDLRVTCTYQQGRELSGTLSTVNCLSTGRLEGMLHEYAEAKAGGEVLPDLPMFTPGQM